VRLQRCSDWCSGGFEQQGTLGRLRRWRCGVTARLGAGVGAAQASVTCEAAAGVAWLLGRRGADERAERQQRRRHDWGQRHGEVGLLLVGDGTMKGSDLLA